MTIDPGLASVLGVIVLVGGGAVGKWFTDRHHDSRQSAIDAAAGQAATGTADRIAERVLIELSTGNGHSIGQGMARLEDGQWKLTNRLDRVEVIAVETQHALTKHIADVSAQAQKINTEVLPVVDQLRSDQADPEHVT